MTVERKDKTIRVPMNELAQAEFFSMLDLFALTDSVSTYEHNNGRATAVFKQVTPNINDDIDEFFELWCQHYSYLLELERLP